MTPRLVDAGELAGVIVACPSCHERADVAIHVGARLHVDEDGTAALVARMRCKPVPHRCGQLRMDDTAADPDQPELVADGDADLDWAQLAAGEGVERRNGYASR